MASHDAASTYARFAKFYDVYVADYGRDIPFYLEMARGCAGPILEIGCGTGRVLAPLAAAGHLVTGIDISEEMLAIARAKPSLASCALLRGNPAKEPLPGKYGLALVTFYTFNYLLTEAEQIGMLRNIFACLQSGAKLILHLFHPTPLAHPERAGIWIDKGSYKAGGEEIQLREMRRMLDGVLEERIQVFTGAAGWREEIRTVRRFVDKAGMLRLLVAAGFSGMLAADDPAVHALKPLDRGAATAGDFVVVAGKE